MNEKETIEFIESYGKFGIRLGLENISALLEELGNPHEKLKYIHVAGTNGKGSVSTMLSAILTNAGYVTGIYTSPALETFNERIQLNMVPISGEDLVAYTDRLKKAAGCMMKKGHPHPTGFEIETALAFLYFYEKKSDICIIEVGMGGRLDATNIIPAPEACVIMSISLDHEEYLGNTLTAIAGEKAAIIKPGCEAVIYPQSQDILDVFLKEGKKQNAPVTVVNANSIKRISCSLDGQLLSYNKKNGVPNLDTFTLKLLGEHQILNCEMVLAVIEILNRRGFYIDGKNIKDTLKDIVFAGRFEIIHRHPTILIDGAHNPGGIESFVKNIRTYFPNQKMNLYFGMLEDKDIDMALDFLMPLTDVVHTLTPENHRALPAKEMAMRIKMRFDKDVTFYETIEKAVDSVDLNDDSKLNVFVGSLYMIGVCRTLFRKRLGEAFSK